MTTKKNPLEACPECGCTSLHMRVEAGRVDQARCDDCGYSYSVGAPVAAAPELLDCLKKMLEEVNDPAGFRLSTIGEAQAVVAKAEG